MKNQNYIDHDQTIIDKCLEQTGYTPQAGKLKTGKWIRFGKNKSLAVKLHHSDGGGYVYLIKDHVSGELVKGCTDDKKRKRPSPDELKALRQKRRERESSERERLHRRKLLLQRYVLKIWHKALNPDQFHGCFKYLTKKGFSYGKGTRLFVSTSQRRNYRRLLLLPMVCPIDQEIYSLYLIYETVKIKRPIRGTRPNGLCMIIADESIQDAPVIWITEGYATGLSLFEDVNQPVVVAFSSGNLLPVVEKLVQAYPKALLKLCADNDVDTEIKRGFNPGIVAANKVKAQFPQVEIFIPQYPEGATGLSDYNDLQQYLRKQSQCNGGDR